MLTYNRFNSRNVGAAAGFVAALACLSLLPAASRASTVTIVSDGFSGANGATINGRTPDGVDLSGGLWGVTTQSGGGLAANPMVLTNSVGNPVPSVNTNFNDAAGISIASAPGYTEPTSLTISADLNMGSINGGGLAYNVYGVGLGFWNSLPAAGATSSTGFTGITMDPYGDLTFISNGTASATAKAAAPGTAVIVGGHISGFNNLKYTVDTVTGAITQVTFDGSDLTSSFSGITAFTPGIATLAGFYGNSPYSASENGYVDNFTVSGPAPVPEPAGVGLVAAGAMGLFLLRKRRIA